MQEWETLQGKWLDWCAAARWGSLLGVAALVPLMGCGVSRQEGGSNIKQLGNKDFACVEYDAAQTKAQLKDMPQGFINEASFRVGKVDRVENQLTGIPRSYLTYLFALNPQNGFRIAERNLGFGTVGVTMRAMPSLTPLTVDLASTATGVDFALQHELGHALEGRVREENTGFATALQGLFQKESRNANLRSYARTQPAEYFAEAFANFYCSKDAQEFIASNVPDTYKLLKTSLAAASWDQAKTPRLAQDTWLQLLDEGEKSIVEISVPTSVKKVALCAGTQDSCLKNPAVFANFKVSPTQIAQRNVFRSESQVALKEDLTLTVLIYDEADKPSAARTIAFAAAAQTEEP